MLNKVVFPTSFPPGNSSALGGGGGGKLNVTTIKKLSYPPVNGHKVLSSFLTPNNMNTKKGMKF